MNPRDVVTYVTSDLLFGVPSTEDNVRDILATLDLQETLILCARLNAIISGIGTVVLASFLISAPLSWFIAPRLRARYWKTHTH